MKTRTSLVRFCVRRARWTMKQIVGAPLWLAIAATGWGAVSGSLDLEFDPGAGVGADPFATVYTLALQNDGAVLLGGEFTFVNGVSRNNIARLRPSGAVDTNFTAQITRFGGYARVNTIVLQGSKILVGGNFDSVNGVTRRGLARLNEDGSLDASFNANMTFNPEVKIFLMQADGRLIISGSFSSVNNTNRNSLARLFPDGGLDLSFTNDFFPGFIYTMAIQPDGKILAGGFFGSGGATPTNMLRMNSFGSLDNSYRPVFDTFGIVRSIAVQPDGRALIAGDFDAVNGLTRYGYARLNTDGTLDGTFALGNSISNQFSQGGRLTVVKRQIDGKILFGGRFTDGGGFPYVRIGRFLTNGVADPNFQSLPFDGSDLDALCVQADGNILVGGGFTGIGGTSRKGVARLNGDARVPAPILRMTRQGTTVSRLEITNPASLPFLIQATTNLSAAIWKPIHTNDQRTNQWQVLQTNSPTAPQRFYRALLSPP